ncbi:hypothetical protein F510_1446 [Anoxybacillus gonensis]|nr:hypothetical protein F510_1446 [Anoxybacillus gonensis]
MRESCQIELDVNVWMGKIWLNDAVYEEFSVKY